MRLNIEIFIYKEYFHNMKIIKLYSNLIILISLIVFSSFSLYAFPKKSSSLIKDKHINIAKSDEINDRLSITGYYLGVANFCSYQGTKDKELYKTLKGVTAQTNWKMFLIVNKGWQLVESDLWIAGHGWAGQSSTWQQKPIDWRYGVTGCEPKTYDLIYKYFDEFIFKVIIYYLYNLSEENFDQNIADLLNLLKNARKGDYSMAIDQIVRIVSDPNFENNIEKNNIQETNIQNYNVSDQNNEDNQNNESSIDAKLTKLKKLFDKELITEEEYKKKKEEILSEF